VFLSRKYLNEGGSHTFTYFWNNKPAILAVTKKDSLNGSTSVYLCYLILCTLWQIYILIWLKRVSFVWEKQSNKEINEGFL